MFRGLKALIAGVVAGTALGILFSPKNGKDFRKKVKDEVEKGGTGLGTIKDTLKEMGKDIGGTCKECYEDISKSEELHKAANNAKEELKKAYRKNVPLETRKKLKKDYNKAKTKAKKAIQKVVKEVKNKKK
ncbi:MAG: YtxH domain-containing protein [Candidatus Peregrinibacteria bacterium]